MREGKTIQNLHCSEVSRWPGDAGETMAGLRAGLPASGELVLESTPNGAEGCFFEEWQKAGRDAENLVRHFLPWWWEENMPPRRDVFGADGRGAADCSEHGLSGRADRVPPAHWAGFRGLARQEYAEDADECFLSWGECVFDAKAWMQGCGNWMKLLTRKGKLLVWYPPVAGQIPCRCGSGWRGDRRRFFGSTGS